MTYTVWVTSLTSNTRQDVSRHENLEAAIDAAHIMLSGGVPVEIAVVDSEGTKHLGLVPGSV